MTGEIKALKQPASSKAMGEVSALEWFRCRWDGRSGIGMIVASPINTRLKTDTMLFIDKDGGLRTLNLDTFRTYNGEFLGYLTTEESVTIHGSLDPDWVEPEAKPTNPLLPDPLPDPNVLYDLAPNVAFRFLWHHFGRQRDPLECIGIKLPDKSKDGHWVVLRISADPDAQDKRGAFSNVVNFREHDPERTFLRYEAEIPQRLRDHPNYQGADWSGVPS